MTDPTLILCTLFSLLIAFAVIYKPLIKDEEKVYFTGEDTTHDFDPSIALLETIQELENDYKLGKLTQKEFDELSLEYKREYLDLKKQNA